MAIEAKARALGRGNAVIPVKLLRLLGDFMSELEMDILRRAGKHATARTARPNVPRITAADLRAAAVSLLSDAPDRFSRRLRQDEAPHARRHAS